MGCDIAREVMCPPGGIIRRSAHFIIHQDPLVPLPGFLVVAAVRHINSIGDMAEDEYIEFAGLVKKTHRAIKNITGVEMLTLVQEERSSHFHLWFFPWAHQIIEKHGQPSLNKIRDIMAEYTQRTIYTAEWAALEETIEKIRNLLHTDNITEEN